MFSIRGGRVRVAAWLRWCGWRRVVARPGLIHVRRLRPGLPGIASARSPGADIPLMFAALRPRGGGERRLGAPWGHQAGAVPLSLRRGA